MDLTRRSFFTEQELAREIRAALDGMVVGENIPDSISFRNAMRALEWFIPQLLREVHPEWNEALDGVYPQVAVKTGENEAEIIGMCILISDQTCTPLHVRLRAAIDMNEIESLECRLGEIARDGKMRRIPYGTNRSRDLAVVHRLNDIVWAYHFAFGSGFEQTGNE